MAFAGHVGLSVDLAAVPYEGAERCCRDSVLLFSESASRFLAEVRAEHADAFEARLSGLPLARVGRATDEASLTVQGLSGAKLLQAPLERLRTAWQTPLVEH